MVLQERLLSTRASLVIYTVSVSAWLSLMTWVLWEQVDHDPNLMVVEVCRSRRPLCMAGA
jgi:hypothetical protein